jgi:putative endonuclease
MNRKDTGILGEKLAKQFLKKKGYRIREQNFKCKYGEIDIIAEKKGYLVFVEVRTKRTKEFGSPEESVTPTKKQKLINLAFSYINEHENLPSLWRIDFVGVELDQKDKATRIEIIENAITD